MNNAWIAALALGALAVMPKDPGHNLMKLPSFRGIVEAREHTRPYAAVHAGHSVRP